MAEPENQTLHLLRDIRTSVRAVDQKVDAVDQKVDAVDRKVDRVHDDLTQRLKSLQQAMIGESVLGRYTVAESRNGSTPSKSACRSSSSAEL